MPYYAVKPKGRDDAIRIEKANTPEQAIQLAFGRGFLGDWEWKNLGTRVSVIHSDSKRRALLLDPAGWTALNRRLSR